jgi:hypothetical protein
MLYFKIVVCSLLVVKISSHETIINTESIENLGENEKLRGTGNEVNITEIMRILNEHEKELIHLQIQQTQTSVTTSGKSESERDKADLNVTISFLF